MVAVLTCVRKKHSRQRGLPCVAHISLTGNMLAQIYVQQVPCCARHMPDTGNKDGCPCQRAHTQVSKITRIYACGALCLTGGCGGELGEMMLQENGTKGSET